MTGGAEGGVVVVMLKIFASWQVKDRQENSPLLRVGLRCIMLSNHSTMLLRVELNAFDSRGKWGLVDYV